MGGVLITTDGLLNLHRVPVLTDTAGDKDPIIKETNLSQQKHGRIVIAGLLRAPAVFHLVVQPVQAGGQIQRTKRPAYLRLSPLLISLVA